MTKYTQKKLEQIAIERLGKSIELCGPVQREVMIKAYVADMKKIMKHRTKLNKERGFSLEILPSHLPSDFTYDYSGKSSNCGYYGSARYKFMNPTKNQVYVKFLKDLNSRKNPVTREALVKKVQPRSKQFNPKVYDCNVFSGLREAGLIYYINRKVCLSMLGKEFLKHFNLV